MPTYLLIVTSIISPSFVYFFDCYDLAVAKHDKLKVTHEDTRLYKIFDGTVKRIHPENGMVEPVTLGREEMIPF